MIDPNSAYFFHNFRILRISSRSLICKMTWTKKILQQIYLKFIIIFGFPNSILTKSFRNHKMFHCCYCVFLSIRLSTQFFYISWYEEATVAGLFKTNPFGNKFCHLKYKYESRGDFLLSFFTFELRACLKTQRKLMWYKISIATSCKILLKCFLM